MKKIICFAVCYLVLFPVYAKTSGSGNDLNALLNDSRHVFDSVDNTDMDTAERLDDIKNKLQLLESEIRKIDPKIVDKVSNYDSDVAKVREYSKILSKYAFDKYKEEYINKIKQYSKEKNRELKVYRYSEARDKDIRYLDMSEHWEIEIYELAGDKLRTNCVKDPRDRGQLCYYPDNYEHYEVKYSKNITRKIEELEISFDVPAAKSILKNWFYLNSDLGALGFLYQNTWTTDYDKEQNKRNQIIQDLANGMIIKACSEDIVPYCFIPPSDGMSGVRTKYYTTHTSASQWKSGHIPEYIGRWYLEKHKD